MSRNPVICAPSASLIPLSKLASCSYDQVCQFLDNLRQIYGPPPTTATLPLKLTLPIRKHRRRIHDDSVPDSGYASAEDDENFEEEVSVITDDYFSEDDSLDVLRADPMERALTTRWLTGFIARSDTWAVVSGSDDGEVEDDERGEAVATAANLLGILLNDNQEEEQDCSVTRSFRFSTQGGRVTIQVELNDAPLSDDDHTSVGLQSWASSIVLSERICTDSERFSLPGDGKPLRILELGAGTGLLSIVAAKLVSSSPSSVASSGPLIFATDYHPDVLVNLQANIAANFPPSSCSDGPPISVHQLDWEHPDYSSPMDQPFDLIVGADVVYHPNHARWIKSCVERLLLRPGPRVLPISGPTGGGVFWLMIALRTSGRHEGMFHTVEDIFPDMSLFPSSGMNDGEVVNRGLNTNGPVADSGVDGCTPAVGPGEENRRGAEVEDEEECMWQLAILDKVEVGKMKGVGRADERGYLLFKIGWVLR
ncbi:hypothetical protein D9757_006930 [Collybiopsis confluens]|uniref:S-adenosylmethionine-dependent methyltransferase n=1 Tax=Collybiopsis confluens TaxID=2823264 RepID=A0A8H5M7V4_9AGAR|nr:hypothetical protein D9757_006930 [Collybiopsis confluens]